ncbi:MAG: rRNA maturation RNase YbeY [Gammaproteobacteria bacterium]|nr:rRNA maturation RNase YbeY [Gammaproteobacteria bacterium]
MDLDYQIALQGGRQQYYLPSEIQVKDWINSVLQSLEFDRDKEKVQLTVRIVSEQEMIQLNSQFRGKHRVTNVLSFPFESPKSVYLPLLGDVVVCAAVVNAEARQQLKQDEQHWAHMIVHGVLHLLGYDHLDEHDAQRMELLERNVLSTLGFPNPYGEINTP